VADTSNERVSTPELRDYFRILSQRKWTAIFVFILVVGGAMYLSYEQKPIYESEAQVLVPPPTAGVSQLGTPIVGKVNLDTEAAIAQSPTVAKPVATALGLDATDPKVIDHLQHEISVAPLKAGDILLFKAEAPDAAGAQRLAEQFATSYLDYARGASASTLQNQIATIRAQIGQKRQQLAALGPASADTPDEASLRVQLTSDITNLTDQINPIQTAVDTIRQTGGGILEDARLPTKPARPNHVRDGLLAAIVGFVLGFGAAFLRDYVDDSLRGVADVERMAGATLVGVIQHIPGPEVARKKDRDGLAHDYLVAADDPKAPATEAYRTLRTNLLFMSATGPLKVLLVTSPLQGEGKSTTAANLAAVMAQAGQRVLLVGADLRRPSIHKFFGMTNRVGLSSVLSGQATLTEAVADPGIRDLRVMPGGPIPPNPAELLGSRRMKEFLVEVGEVADWVILDGPPALGLADALVLSAIADGTLIVVNEATNRRILAHARDQLAKVSARTVGVVLNNFGPAFSYYYSDYYMYSSTYYASAEPDEVIAEPKQKKPSRRERKRMAAEAANSGFASSAPQPADAAPIVTVPNGEAQDPAEGDADRGSRARGIFSD
jgi:polysaccharide biosynthesis transport protein